MEVLLAAVPLAVLAACCAVPLLLAWKVGARWRQDAVHTHDETGGQLMDGPGQGVTRLLIEGMT